ncbi:MULTISPECIES: AAA family ATPase [Halostella]|uniref:AAA family ATPase n=1 Tax=Halostella TaxID=1843185 RepID=UPI001081E0F9|nr:MULTISPECIES: AAA family ATPase [Halostella]
MADTGSATARETAADHPQLVVVCGPPGVGKTTVSEGVADRIDGELLRTDVVREDVAPDPEYTDAERKRVYDELFARGRKAVRRGENAVLDGTFQYRPVRERAQSLADELGAEFRSVKVECAEPVVRERIAGRTDDESDADFEVHAMIREQFDPLSVDHVTVDNSETLAETQRQLDRLF